MTKAELIEKIAKDADIPKATAKVAFDSALDGINNGLKKGIARSPWWDLGPSETFIEKPRWAVIPKQAKRSKSKGALWLPSSQAKTCLSRPPSFNSGWIINVVHPV